MPRVFSLGRRLFGRLWRVCLPCTVLLAACGAERNDSFPNVLLVSLDTTRADHCSMYGYEVETTPNLRQLASEGARFDLAYSPTSTTGPTHATIFTGLYPVTHRVVKNGLSLSEEFPTLAELLQDQGYQTAAILGSFALSHRFNYDQGFTVYDDAFTRPSSTHNVNRWAGHEVESGFDRRADDTTTRALEWLRSGRSPDNPFLLFVHYFDPHAPYAPPPEYLRDLAREGRKPRTELEKEIAHYDGEIAFSDREVGRLLDGLRELGLDGDTVVILTGDHGEGLMDHDYMYHGAQIYEEMVRVPLVIRWPGEIPPRVFADPVELVDLAPTIFGLIGHSPKDVVFQGRSLAGPLRGAEDLDPDRPVFLHRRHYEGTTLGSIYVQGEKYGIRMGQWKYITGPEEGTHELFDLAADPQERTNLYDASRARADAMAERLQSWRDAHEISGAIGTIPAEDLEKLKALGYTN